MWGDAVPYDTESQYQTCDSIALEVNKDKEDFKKDGQISRSKNRVCRSMGINSSQRTQLIKTRFLFTCHWVTQSGRPTDGGGWGPASPDQRQEIHHSAQKNPPSLVALRSAIRVHSIQSQRSQLQSRSTARHRGEEQSLKCVTRLLFVRYSRQPTPPPFFSFTHSVSSSSSFRV